MLNIKKIFRTKRYTSAQLVAKCYADAGIQIFDDKRRPSNVSPGDIAIILSGKRLLALKTRPLVRPTEGESCLLARTRMMRTPPSRTQS